MAAKDARVTFSNCSKGINCSPPEANNPPPPEGLRMYIRLLLEHGIEPDEVRAMVKDNSERLLGLSEGS